MATPNTHVKRKIMVVTPYFLPEIGGLENYALGIVMGLKALGHDVVVVAAARPASPAGEETLQGVRIIRLKTWLVASNTPVNPLWYWQLRRIIRAERPHVINAHTPVPFVADMAARAAGRIPVVLTYHNDLAKASRVLGLIVSLHWHLLGRGTLGRSRRVITTSDFYAERSPFLQPVRNKVDIVTPGVDTGRFNASVDREVLRRQFPGKRIVLFVGSLAPSHAHKGLDLLIDAVARLRQSDPSLHLVAVGKGSNIAHYQAHAAAAGVTGAVTFTGYVSDDELPAYYAGADVFVLPSTNMAEGFGMVLLEAAACGTPVVGTEVGGIPAALAAAGSPYVAVPTVEGVTATLARALRSGGRVNPAVPSWTDAAARTLASFERALQPRVALLHNIVSPYRLPVFAELARRVDLVVLFCVSATRDRVWDTAVGDGFASRLLAGRAFGPVIVNPLALITLWRLKPDVIITNTDLDTATASLAALVVAKLRRARLVVWSEVIDEDIQSIPQVAYATGGIMLLIRRALTRFIVSYRHLFFGHADAAIAFSGKAEAFLRRHGVAGERVSRGAQVVPAGLMPEASSADRNGKTVLYMGYLNRRKAVDQLIMAFADVPDADARLVIAGSGSDEARLRELASSDPRVGFTGYLDGPAKAAAYAAADILVLPSLADCWGLVVNEAVRYGLAVVVSDAAGAAETVTSKAGVVVPAGNAGALAGALNELINDPRRLRAMQHHNAGATWPADVNAAASGIERAITGAAA